VQLNQQPDAFSDLLKAQIGGEKQPERKNQTSIRKAGGLLKFLGFSFTIGPNQINLPLCEAIPKARHYSPQGQ